MADAELIRKKVTGGRPWSVLGQSFGGFCTVAYLSQAPDGLREAFVTGGLPGLDTTADDVYRRTYQMVAAKNREHYERYPQDVERARRVARALADAPARLPGGMRADGGGVPVAGADPRLQHRQPHAALPAGGPVRRAAS